MNSIPKWLVAVCLVGVISLVSCATEPDSPSITGDDNFEISIPQGFPEIKYPDGNEFTRDRWLLGKKLFYDPIMSVDSTVACANCHVQTYGFASNLPTNEGVDKRAGTRNPTALSNLAWAPYYTSEGGVPTLEMQVLVPIQEHNEFDFNIIKIAERLARIPAYSELSEKAYGKKPDYSVVNKAVANFERSLISGNSRYDQHFLQDKNNILNKTELAGYALFTSERTQCASCHSGFNFTNYAFENNGLALDYSDIGRKKLTGEDTDLARFKVPSLRNIELSAPYMHDGSIATLEEVIEHYNSGGHAHPSKSDKIKPLNLSSKEKEQLLAFLKTLTDQNFIDNHSLFVF